jgi:hypothetical protein
MLAFPIDPESGRGRFGYATMERTGFIYFTMFFFSIPSIEKILRIRDNVVARILKGLVATREDGRIGAVGAPGNAGRGFRGRGRRGRKCHSFPRDQNKQ